MTDHTWAIGSNGSMMIRDTGTFVEFWITANNSTTSAGSLPWGYTVNGVTDNSNTYDYNAGAGWQRLGRWSVTTDQTVYFRLFDTGTSGLGAGATHAVAIDRASVPPAPRIISLAPTNVSIVVDVNSGGTGGLAITRWQVAYSTSATMPGAPANIFPNLASGVGTITGLTTGTTYYLWARGENSKGWGPWSARVSTKTHTVPPAPTAPLLTEATQTSVRAAFTSNGTGGPAILEWQIGYGTDPATPTTWVTFVSGNVVANLTPGADSYFWVRGRNVYGFGPASARAALTLFAGAHMTYGAAVKRAVPYVKGPYGPGGLSVWKVAEIRVNIKGLWKGTG
jgi:hypothetical protein